MLYFFKSLIDKLVKLWKLVKSRVKLDQIDFLKKADRIEFRSLDGSDGFLRSVRVLPGVRLLLHKLKWRKSKYRKEIDLFVSGPGNDFVGWSIEFNI
jgi:hypothetical protein